MRDLIPDNLLNSFTVAFQSELESRNDISDLEVVIDPFLDGNLIQEVVSFSWEMVLELLLLF